MRTAVAICLLVALAAMATLFAISLTAPADIGPDTGWRSNEPQEAQP